jgi:hypothetical protein
MKRLLTILSFFLFTVSAQSQHYVFVLVDISKSIKQSELANAKQSLTEVLTGQALSKAFITQGNQQELGNFKIMQGDYLAISKFGSLQTTLSISPNLTHINNANFDVSQVLNSISWEPFDGQTYLILGKAKIAEYAKNHQIAKYKLYIISDNVQDDYGPGGKPNYPDEYTRNLAEGYNTSNNPVSESGYTKIKFTVSSLFTLSFSPNVDVSKYSPPTNGPLQITGDSIPETPMITLTTFQDGKKDKPKPTNSNSFIISWVCNNCRVGTKYNVLLTEIDGGNYKELKKNLLSSPVKFTDVPSGKYKIIVSAPDAIQSTTYIETPSSVFGWILLVLILTCLCGYGYYRWKKKQEDKLNISNNDKSDNIFSEHKNISTPTNSSTNSEYW